MAVNLVSPGVKIREIDLTIGRVDAGNNQVGAFAGPFVKGPVDYPVFIETEQDLINVFGKPSINDLQNEYWLSASNYLTYGGVLRVVRTDSSVSGAMNNANSTSSGISTSLAKIKSIEDYVNKNTAGTLTNFAYAAKDPGSWGNDLKVCAIDAAADQLIGIGTYGLAVGYGITSTYTATVAGVGTVTTESGLLKGIITGIGNSSINVKVVSRYKSSTNSYVDAVYSENTLTAFGTGNNLYVRDNSGTLQNIERTRFIASIGSGSTAITPISAGASDILPVSSISIGDVITCTSSGIVTSLSVTGFGTAIGAGTTNVIVQTILLNGSSVGVGTAVTFVDSVPSASGLRASSAVDWYNSQTLGLANATIYWKSIAPKPGTSQYASERNSKNDEIHIAIVDDKGTLTGTAGNIVEKFTNLSKASDGKLNPSEAIYYKDYLAYNSAYIYVGANENGQATGFTAASSFTPVSGGSWGTVAQGNVYTGIGNKTYTLSGGTDYTSGVGNYAASLSNITSSYNIFANPAEYSINFIINGPSGGANSFESQAKANAIVSLATNRKDCIAVLSPHKTGVVNIANSDTQTSNIVEFFSGVTASNYAVFDCGYKYTFDRFNNQFLYLSCNSDIAGLMARTSINQYPWYSPAGASRGVLNNAIKLAYNPTQAQRDLLYSNKINPVIASPGQGIILFGDKTASAVVSAFDRINVRRLFLTLEATIEQAARAQLFEFNDIITRSNFVNIVEPYLRDVKAKRGIIDFLLVCDESNNTPDIIDANQFKADIFVKPARSTNFIGITFVATRTGVSFSEIVGSV
jgi:hypothetical protein